MKVLMLAGGFGTRLRPLTLYKPKQLLKLGEKSIIEHLLESLKKADLEKISIAVNSAHENVFKENLGSGINWIVEKPVEEGEKLGAVGAIWNAKKFFEKESLLVIGADNFAPSIDFKKIIREHIDKGNIATLVLHKLVDKNQVNKFGVALTKEDRIVGFQEKPAIDQAKSNLISTAFYVIEPDFFEKLEKYIHEKKQQGKKPDNLGDLWAWMVDKGMRIGYFVLDSYWSDIGSFNGYIQAQKLILQQKNKKFITGKNSKLGDVKIGENVVIGNNCIVGHGCEISNSIIHDNVKIGKNCKILDSIIDEGSIVSDNHDLINQVVERGTLIN